MTGCCNPRGCERFFTPRFARRVAKRYRKRGLDKTARRIVEFLEQRGIEGATVLDALVFSYPPRNAASRLFIAAQNLIFSLLRREFRTFAHPPSAMLAVLEGRGLRRTSAQHTLVWQVAGLER